MHYFKRNIGDYHKKAGRLTMLEHGAYTLLMDACYDRELFPTQEEAIKWCWARSDEEKRAVLFVLEQFFVLDGEVYVQQRIADEIDYYRNKSAKNKEIALAREATRRAIRARHEHETCTDGHLTTNQEPVTTNQEPVFKNTCDQQAESQSPEAPKQPRRNWVKELAKLGVDEKHAKDWMTARKQKKSPMTDTALEGVIREAAKAGITLDDAVKIAAENSWVGFKASWMDKAKTSHSAAPVNRQQQIEDANAAVVREIMERENRINQRHDHPGELFDIGDPIIIEGEVIHAQ
jgi:uncharacterized protein YdaU (DUF1376 family)